MLDSSFWSSHGALPLPWSSGRPSRLGRGAWQHGRNINAILGDARHRFYRRGTTMPDTVMPLGIAVLAVAIALLLGGSPAHAQHCETVECATVECWWLGPGHRRCRRVCRKRCWQPPPPRYEPRVHAPAPEPSYQTPRHVAAAHADRTPQPPAPAAVPDPGLLFVLLGSVGVIVLVIVAAVASERAAVDRLHKATDTTRTHAEKAGALTARATMTADEIDRYIAQQIAQAYDRGRNSLPEPPHGR